MGARTAQNLNAPSLQRRESTVLGEPSRGYRQGYVARPWLLPHTRTVLGSDLRLRF